MATGQCVTLPTLTRTDEEIVGTRTVETEVLTTTTAPPTFITSTISTNICTTNTTSPISSSCTPTFITTIETVPGETTVLTLTTSVESPITSSITTTLFTTSCTTPNNNNNDTPTPTPTPDPNTSPTITTTSTSSTTLPNGSISVSTYTLTTNTPPAPTTQSDGSSSNSDGPNVGAIAGGVVGGFVGLLALAMISWYFYKKSTSGFDRVFNNPDDFEPSHNQQDKLGPLDDEVQGKGYQYGLVGNEIGNGAGGNGVNASGHAGNGNGMGTFTGGQEQLGGFQGPSGANEMGYQPSGNETGYQPGGNDTGYQSDMGHGRTHSLAPLLGAVGGAATGAAVYAAASTANRDNNNNGGSRPGSSGRPSTGGSSKPLITPGPSPQAYGPQQGYGTQTYPPQSQGYSRTSYYGSSDHNHTATAYNPSLNTNPSVGSSSWGGGSSSSYAAPQPHVGMMAPLVAGAAPLAMNRPQSFDQDGRSGSPVSIQEQRVLQVINPDAGLASSPPQGASALASPTSPIGGSSSGHRTNPSVDGKGRPIDTRGQFVPIVHLDGGAYEEPPRNAVAGRSDGPLPPAYSS